MLNRLKELRMAKGYTQMELAKKSGISFVTINKLENNPGKSVNSQTVANICAALNCTVNDFFITAP